MKILFLKFELTKRLLAFLMSSMTCKTCFQIEMKMDQIVIRVSSFYIRVEEKSQVTSQNQSLASQMSHVTSQNQSLASQINLGVKRSNFRRSKQEIETIFSCGRNYSQNCSRDRNSCFSEDRKYLVFRSHDRTCGFKIFLEIKTILNLWANI